MFPLKTDRFKFRTSVLLALCLGAASTPALAQYDLSWHTVDGGGATFSTGGGFELGGTIGQPDAGSFDQPLSGGGFTMVGGFWPAAGAPCGGFIRADANCDGAVDFFDIDAFILALLDPDVYALNYSGCNYLCTNDVNEDGAVDFFDLDPFVTCVVNGGCL